MSDNIQTKISKLITYGKFQLSSKGVTSTSTTMRGVIDNISDVVIGGNSAQLHEPTIVLTGSTLMLTNPSTNGNFAIGFNIYSNSALLTTQLIDVTTLDLSTLITEAGTYTITATCYGTNMTESTISNNIIYNVTNGYTVTIIKGYGDKLILYDSNTIFNEYTLLGSMEGAHNSSNSYIVKSGYLTIENSKNSTYYNTSYFNLSNGTTGGVTLLSNDGQYMKFSVTGDGTISGVNLYCFVKGTLIPMADGAFKKVEDIDYNDEVKGWNFDNGEQGSGKVFAIMKPNIAPVYWEVEFANGTLVKLVGARNTCHRIFNATQGKFIYPQHFNDGDLAFDGIKNEFTTIVRCEKITKDVEYYNFAVSGILNNYADGILCGNRFSNIYPIENMKFVKDNRQLIPREKYSEIPDYLYDGLRLAEQPIRDDCKDNVQFYSTMKEHIIHNYMEHDKRWTGKADYEKWLFKK